MNHVLTSILFLAACVFIGGQDILAEKADAPKLPPHKKTKVGLYASSKQAFEKMKADKSIVLLDVRTPEEYKAGYPEKAHFIPFKLRSSKGMKENPDFLKQVSKQLDKKQVVLVICHSGVRSAAACNQLHAKGFEKVYTVYDGYAGWAKAGLPIAKAKK